MEEEGSRFIKRRSEVVDNIKIVTTLDLAVAFATRVLGLRGGYFNG